MLMRLLRAPTVYVRMSREGIVASNQPVEGGLTPIELRALQEMAMAAGAREAIVVAPEALPAGEAIPAAVLARAYSRQDLERELKTLI